MPAGPPAGTPLPAEKVWITPEGGASTYPGGAAPGGPGYPTGASPAPPPPGGGGLGGFGNYIKEGWKGMSFQQKVMALTVSGMGIQAAIAAAQDEPWENSESSYAGPSSWEGRGSATFPSAGRTSSSEWNFYA